jgi:hypothetical protein
MDLGVVVVLARQAPEEYWKFCFYGLSCLPQSSVFCYQPCPSGCLHLALGAKSGTVFFLVSILAEHAIIAP